MREGLLWGFFFRLPGEKAVEVFGSFLPVSFDPCSQKDLADLSQTPPLSSRNPQKRPLNFGRNPEPYPFVLAHIESARILRYPAS